MDKKTFTDWCVHFAIAPDKAASKKEAAGIADTDTFTEIQFRKLFPLTVEDWLKVTSSIKAVEREEFCSHYGFALDDEIDEETFKEASSEFVKSKEPAPSSTSTGEDGTYTVLSPLRNGGKRYEIGEKVDLSNCSSEEIERLKSNGVID